MAKYSNTIAYQIQTKLDATGLNQLQQQLSSVSKSFTEMGKNNSAYAESSMRSDIARIQQVQQALSKSFNTNLNLIDLSTFKKELGGLSFGELQSTMSQIPEGAKAFNSILGTVGQIDTGFKNISSLSDKIMNTFGNTVRWGITASIFQTIQNSLYRSVDYVKELDTSLNNIQIVTGETSSNLAEWAKSANEAAAQLGASTVAFTDAAQLYAQNGYTQEDYTKLAELTTKVANVTQQSTSEVSEQITSLMAGYKMSIDEAETSLAGMAVVAAASASDLGELASAEQKVASAASTLGVSQDELTAQLSTIISVTREAPEQVGNSLKTIYARLGDLSLGETLEDGVTLGDVSSTLDKVGIAVLDVNGEMRSMGDILEDLMAKWQELGQAEQQALAVKLAGKYQYNNLMTLMNNSDMYYEQKEMAGSSQGALDEQQAIYMESMEAKLQTLQTKWEGVIQSVVNADTFKPFIDAASTGLDIVSDIADTIGGMGPALTLVASLMTKAFSQNIASGITNMVTNKKRSNLLAQNEDAIIATMGGSDLNGTAATFLKNTVGNRSTLTGEQAVDYNEKLQRYVEVDNQLVDAEAKVQAAIAESQSVFDEYGITVVEATGEVSGYGARALEDAEKSNMAIDVILLKLKEMDNALINVEQDVDNTADDLHKKVTLSIEDIEQFENALNDLTTKDDKFSAFSEDAEILAEEIRGLFETLKSGEGTLEDLKSLRADINQVASSEGGRKDSSVSEQKTAVARVQKAIEEARAARLASENAEENALADAQSVAYQQLTQQIMNVVSSVGQLAFAWQSFQNLGSIWADSDITTGEKVYKTFLAVVTVVPQIVSAAQSVSSAFTQIQAALGTLNDIGTATQKLSNDKKEEASAELANQGATEANSQSKNKNKQASKEAGEAAKEEAEAKKQEALVEGANGEATSKNTEKKEENAIVAAAQGTATGALATAEGAATVATNLLTTAQEALNTAFKANPIGLFITVIGLAVSAISALTSAIQSANEEALEKQAEKVEETKTSWESLSSTISAFDSAYETFKSTGEVTDSLAQSARDAADALGVEGATALIAADNYDKLAEAIKNKKDAEAQASIETIDSNSSKNNESLNGTWNNGSTDTDFDQKMMGVYTTLGSSYLDSLGLESTSSGKNSAYENISTAEGNINKLQARLKELGNSYNEATYDGTEAAWNKEKTAIQGAIDKLQEYLDLEDVKTAKNNAAAKAAIAVGRYDFQDALASAGSIDDIKKIFSGEDKDYGTADYFKTMEDDYSAQLEYMIANVEDASAKAKLELEQSKISFGQALFTKIKDTAQDANLEIDENQINETVKSVQEALDQTSLTDSQKVNLMADIDWSKSLPNILKTLVNGVKEIESQLPAIKIDTDTTDLTNAIDTKNSMSSLVSKYDDASGLTEDEVAEIVSENPDYLQYLTKVGDNYVLNKNALEEWNKATKEQTEQLEAAQGKFNSAFFDDYQDSLDEAIQKARELRDATAKKDSSDGHDYSADSSALDNIANMGQAVSNASVALENGEISVQEYFNSFDDAFNNNNIEDIFNNLSTYADDTRQTIEELASTLQEGLANGVSQASKQVKNGQMSLTDYNKLMRKAAESAEEYQAGLKGLRKEGKKFVQITDDEKDGVEKLTDEQQDFVDSCDKVEDAIQGSYDVDDMSQALTDNYDYLSSFMDDLGNVNANVDWSSIVGTENFKAALEDMGEGFASYISGSEENLNTFAANMGMTGDQLVNELGGDKEKLLSDSAVASSEFQNYAAQDESTFSGATQASMATAAGGISTIASYAGTAIDALGSLIGGFEGSISVAPSGFGIDWQDFSFDFFGKSFDFKLPLPHFEVQAIGSLTGSSADAASTLSSSLKNLGGAVSDIGLSDFKAGGSGSSVASPSSFGNVGSGSSGSSGGSSSSPSSGSSDSGTDDNYDDSTVDITENEIDRYEKVNAHLDDISNNLDKVADEQDRLTGQKYIENLMGQVSLLKEQVEWEQKKLEIEKQEAAEYKNILGSNFGVKFNNQGFVENYADIYNQLLAQLNSYEQQYNASTDKTAKESLQKQIDSAQDRLNSFSDYIDKYDTLLTATITESERKIQEYYDKIEDLRIEAYNNSIEALSDLKSILEDRADFNTALNRLLSGDYGDDDPYQGTLNALEKIKAYWNADSEAMQKYYDTLISKQKEIINSSAASDAEKKWAQTRLNSYNTLKQNHASALGSTTGDGLLSMAMKDLSDIQAQYEQFQKTGTSEVFGENSAELIEMMKTVEDNAKDIVESLKDSMSDLKDSILDTIDKVNDEIDDMIDKYDNINDKLDTYYDLVETINGETDYDALNQVLDAQIVNGQNQVTTINQTIESLKQMQAACKEGSDEWKKLEETIEDQSQKLLETTQDTLDKMVTKYQNAVKKAMDSWTSNTPLGTDLDWVKEEWEMITDNANQYLDDVNSAYNIQKLQSKYLTLLDGSNSLSVQSKITEQMNQQLAYLREKDKLSQYDVDYANAQLEILQKTIALEEAQANKNQMKLKRDNQGNYSYVYSANESDVASAQSDLLDAQNSAYNLSKDAMVQNQEDALNKIISAKEKILNLYLEAQKTGTDVSDKVAEVVANVTEYLNGCSEQFKTAQSNIINDFYSMVDSLSTDNLGNLQEIFEQMQNGNNEAFNNIDERFSTSIGSWLENLDEFKKNTTELFSENGALQKAFKDYESNLEALAEKAKVPLTNMSTAVSQVKDEMDKLNASTATYQSTLKDLSGTIESAEAEYQKMQSQISNAQNAMRAFQSQYNDVSQKLAVAEREKSDLQSEYQKLQREYDAYKDEQARKAAEASSAQSAGGGDGSWDPYNDAYGIWVYGWYGNGGYWYGNYAAEHGEEKANQVLALFNSGYGYTWMDTGGYTGDWGSNEGWSEAKNGKLAVLHSKELVLNASDTENILQAVQAVRQLTTNFRNGAFEDAVSAFNKYGSDLLQTTVEGLNSVAQDVHISATFPNVRGAEEIESALLSLTNGAVQYASRNGQF